MNSNRTMCFVHLTYHRKKSKHRNCSLQKPQRRAVSSSSTSALSNKAHGRALTLCMTIHRLPLTNPQSPSYTSSVKRRHADFINPPKNPPFSFFPSVLSAGTSEISVQTDSSLFLRHQGVVLSCLAHGCILNVKKPEILVRGVQSRQLTFCKPAPLHTNLPKPHNMAHTYLKTHKHMNNLDNSF